MTSILIIDDDQELAELFQEYLQRESFDVSICLTGRQGLATALTGTVELVILDMMLPDMTGTEVLLQIRQHSQLPVLMFTAKGDDIDRIIGLEAGADDYVPKPCSPRELVARIRAILRRTEASQSKLALSEHHIQIGALALWPQKRQALWHSQPLELTSTEFSLLEVLARHAGQIVSKKILSEQALGRSLARFDRSIDVHMSSIRQKLGQQTAVNPIILTIRGQGYQLIKDES